MAATAASSQFGGQNDFESTNPTYPRACRAPLGCLMELKHEELVALTSTLSLGVLVNTLYTLAQPHDLGGFGCVFHFFNQVIGAEEVWRTSESEPEKPAPVAEPKIVH
jgi:hypothetical protein